MKIGNLNPYTGATNLGRTVLAISRSLERLSTGKRVNRPQDDPASFALSERLDSQVRGLNESVRGVNEAMGLVETASSAYSSQLELVQRMREIALQGSSSTISSTTRSELTKELQGLLDEYKKISQNSSFRGIDVLSGANITLALGDSGQLTEFELADGDAATTMTDVVGMGAFQPTKTFGSTLSSPELVDVNNDGHLDVVGMATGGGAIRVDLGTGNGNFSPSITFGTSTGGLAVGDFDGNGTVDIAANIQSNIVWYSGAGDGTFTVAQTLNSGWDFGFLSSADVDNDGDLDLIHLNDNIATGSGTGNWHVVLNDGDGLFSAYSTTALLKGNAGTYIDGLALKTVDFDGDGNTDVIINYSFDDGVNSYAFEVAYGNGDGTFATSTTVWQNGTGTSLSLPDVADVNRDGFGDIAFNYGTNIHVLKGTGAANFVTATYSSVLTGSVTYLRIADYDSDGNLDIVPGRYSALLLDGAWGIKENRSVFHTSAAAAPLIGDLNQDGVNDVISVAAATQTIYLQKSREVSGLGKVSIETTDKAARLLSILDRTIENLTENLGQAAAVHSRLDQYAAGSLLMSETLSEAKQRATEVDFALETAELVRLQILQDAQVAVRAQANVQLQKVISLLNGL